MQKLADSEQLSAERRVFNPTAVTAVPDKEIDLLINSYPHLTKTGEPHEGWLAKSIRTIGADKFKELAGIAVKGDNPDRYFSWLLKRELRKH